MRVNSRCNRRSCQARRNLSKRPELYVKWPKCHMGGCVGLMYVDEYRMRGGVYDNPPQCDDPTCEFALKHFKRSGRVMTRPHRISNDLCSHYNEYVTQRNTKPRSKHSPIPENQWVPF